MIITIIYMIFSFLLDAVLSNIFPSYLGNFSYFMSIYLIVSLVIICPYFVNDKKYFILILIFGLLFDILYTSTFIFNMFLFVVIGLFIKFMNNYFPDNFLFANIGSILAIMLYHLLSFIILYFVSDISYDFYLLWRAIIGSIICTIIYSSISYLVMGFVYKKFNIKQIK